MGGRSTHECLRGTAVRRAILPALIGAGLLLAGIAVARQPASEPQDLEDAPWLRQSAGPQGPNEGMQRRQPWLLPIPGERVLMHATLFRPPGPGRFPLAVINHRTIQAADVRQKYRMPEYPLITQWFLDRGYAVVVPQRPGHGDTGGPYFEDQGMCEDPDYLHSGVRTADSIEAAVEYMTAQPFVRKTGA